MENINNILKDTLEKDIDIKLHNKMRDGLSNATFTGLCSKLSSRMSIKLQYVLSGVLFNRI